MDLALNNLQRLIWYKTQTTNRPYGNADFYSIVAGVLQGDTFTPYFLIFWKDHVLQTSIDLISDNDFMLKKRLEVNDIREKS